MGVLRQSGNLLFVTSAYVVVDAGSGTLAYGQAGHPTGYLRRASGKVELLPAEGDVAGPALGLIDGFPYESGRQSVGPGDTAILFTDGLTEARTSEGEEWGQERLVEEMGRTAATNPAGLLSALVAAAASFAGGQAFEDDVCIVALQVAR
jgi:sigma-B regulation protein RsbU (phosphoserine phosphatase)